ncbi:hypothetical protein LTR37_001904 [Vermiconidia calcicola]|uniref:Uncharacterized protein n=1 Tax=Vermiconidia calcicola TaxID=1690605 RepID=A0ACC3NUK1_9PEZI|nr:hypothetical protein LTR37_001904 [Vermiconidia calcicola]
MSQPSSPTIWQRVKTGSKTGFDKAWKAADKLGAPVNRLSNKLGSEAFWPTTLDKESDKAARILKTFCKDGFYTEEEVETEEGPKQKQKVVKKIPTSVIKNAKGLAIFTTMRSGLWVSGAGGSGVLIARKEDGTWSPPSGILLHTAGLGFLVGVDIYDCVIVINTDEALEAFTHVRCTLGSEVSVSAGPVGAGGVLETEVHKRQSPVFNYMKSRGFYAGVQIDGTVIIERTDENERFYGQRIPVKEILAGKVTRPPFEVRRLLETIKAAQGDTDVDESFLPTEAPPSDYEIDDGHVMSVPDKDDPDPYGVLALEKEGMSMKEAGTLKRASWEAFSFNPAPTSPVHNIYARNSVDVSRSASQRSSWRMSAFSNEPKTPSSLRTSMEIPPVLPPRTPTIRMSDSATQTDELPEPSNSSRWSTHSSPQRHSSRSSFRSSKNLQMQEVPEDKVLDTSPERRGTESTIGARENSNSPGSNELKPVTTVNGYTTPPRTPPAASEKHQEPDTTLEEDVHIEEPIVQLVQTIQPANPQLISKARLVTVPKRVAPRLPPRNPNRSGPMVIDASPKDAGAEDTAEVESKHDSARESVAEKDVEVEPVKQKLEDVNLDGDEDEEAMRPNPWAKVEETRQRQEQEQERPTIPGSFQ